MEALKSELNRVLRSAMKVLHQRIDKIENSQQKVVDNFRNGGRRGRGGRGGRGRNSRRSPHYEEDIEDYAEDNLCNNNLGTIKMNIPSFQGNNDPELYLEWERKVELMFESHNYSELKKVKIAVIEFSDYALVWWDQLVSSRRQNREQSRAKNKPSFTPRTDSTTPSRSITFDGRNHDRKCFKCQGYGHIASECPNRRVMVICDDGEVVTDEESEIDDLNMQLLEAPDEDVEEIEAPAVLNFVTIRVFSVQTVIDDVSSVRISSTPA